MKNLISVAITVISSVMHKLQAQQFVSVMLMGFLLLVTNVGPDLSDQATIDQLDKMVHQEDPDRPKTTAEWQQQARETKGNPQERIKRIGKQSAEAVKEFGATYPDVAKKSVDELRHNK
jgi:hypothetical protein